MIDELVRDYLDRADAALPGFVGGLYIVGSAALGAWQPALSDVDTIILTSRPAEPSDLVTLAAVHAAAPRVDGVYLEPAAVRAQPMDRPVVPFVVDGTLVSDRPCGELTPVVWLTLQKYGLRVRGPLVTDLKIDVPPGLLRQYNLDNLRGYWQSAVATFPSALAALSPEQVVDAETVTWYVLGPARLHYTLAHHDIISKAAAGDYLASLFPVYADLAERAVRWRSGDPEEFTAADLAAAGRATTEVADDAWRQFGG